MACRTESNQAKTPLKSKILKIHLTSRLYYYLILTEEPKNCQRKLNWVITQSQNDLSPPTILNLSRCTAGLTKAGGTDSFNLQRTYILTATSPSPYNVCAKHNATIIASPYSHHLCNTKKQMLEIVRWLELTLQIDNISPISLCVNDYQPE